MDFTTIGTIASYIRQKNMKFAANHKVKTGQNVTDANGDLNFAKTNISAQLETKKRSEEEVSAARIASIKQKLANGRKLSNEELSCLRAREPKTYKRAKHADEAREELKGELKKAKTKQEAKQAVTQAMIKASAQASADIANYKSNSKSSSTSTDTQTNLNSVSEEVDGLKNALHSTFAENWGYTEESSFGGTGSGNSKESANFEESENEFANWDYNQSKNISAPSIKNQNSDRDSPQEVMENFIMTIRALEATWAEFTKSKEYDDLPDNKWEEEFLNAIGETKRDNRYKKIETPKAKNLNAATAYRTSMMFRTPQFVVSPLPKFEQS